MHAAIVTGADLSMVWPKVALALLTDEAFGVLRHVQDPRHSKQKAAIDHIAELYRKWIAGTKPADSQFRNARADAAAAAYAADAAYAAYAAYAAAYAAYAADARTADAADAADAPPPAAADAAADAAAAAAAYAAADAYARRRFGSLYATGCWLGLAA